MATTSAASPRSACVIGAGAAGLITAHYLRQAGLRVSIFEAKNRLGGLWSYSDEPKDGVMYASLRTNLPKEIMAFKGDPFPAQLQSFLTHTQVNAYLHAFALRHHLIPDIRFSSPVTDVSPVSDSTWRVTADCPDEPSPTSEEFDFVVVANGHYDRPLYPSIPGLYSHFLGTVLHSAHYRRPSTFSEHNVLVIGSGPSGQDMAVEIASVARSVTVSVRANKVQVSHDVAAGKVQDKTAAKKGLPSNLCEVTEVSRVTPDGCIELVDGTLLTDISVVLLCTGYEYTFPFLSPACRVTIVDGKRVHPLFKQVFNAHIPSMAFIGIPWRVIPMPLFEAQAELVARVFSGAASLPSEADMLKDVEAMYAGQEAEDQPLRYTHMLGAKQWDYRQDLWRLGCIDAKLSDWMTDSALELPTSPRPLLPATHTTDDDTSSAKAYASLCSTDPVLKLQVDRAIYTDVFHSRRENRGTYRGREYSLAPLAGHGPDRPSSPASVHDLFTVSSERPS